MGSHVSEVLDNTLLPLDFDATKDLLRRAMQAAAVPNDAGDEASILVVPVAPRIAAGCLLFHILQQDERVARLYQTIDEEEDEDGDGLPLKRNSRINNTTEMMQVAEDTLTLLSGWQSRTKRRRRLKIPWLGLVQVYREQATDFR